MDWNKKRKLPTENLSRRALVKTSPLVACPHSKENKSSPTTSKGTLSPSPPHTGHDEKLLKTILLVLPSPAIGAINKLSPLHLTPLPHEKQYLHLKILLVLLSNLIFQLVIKHKTRQSSRQSLRKKLPLN